MAKEVQTIKDFKKALEELPSDLEDLYRTILSRVKYPHLVKDALMWIIGSDRELTTEELRGAIESESSEDKIFLHFEGFLQREAGSLIQISHLSKEQSIVRLIHGSLRDFITEPNLCKDENFLLPATAIQSNITIRCLRYLSICSSPDPFSKYAVHNWMEHFRQVKTSSDEFWLVIRELHFFLHGKGLDNWIKWEYERHMGTSE